MFLSLDFVFTDVPSRVLEVTGTPVEILMTLPQWGGSAFYSTTYAAPAVVSFAPSPYPVIARETAPSPNFFQPGTIVITSVPPEFVPPPPPPRPVLAKETAPPPDYTQSGVVVLLSSAQYVSPPAPPLAVIAKETAPTPDFLIPGFIIITSQARLVPPPPPPKGVVARETAPSPDFFSPGIVVPTTPSVEEVPPPPPPSSVTTIVWTAASTPIGQVLEEDSASDPVIARMGKPHISSGTPPPSVPTPPPVLAQETAPPPQQLHPGAQFTLTPSQIPFTAPPSSQYLTIIQAIPQEIPGTMYDVKQPITSFGPLIAFVAPPAPPPPLPPPGNPMNTTSGQTGGYVVPPQWMDGPAGSGTGASGSWAPSTAPDSPRGPFVPQKYLVLQAQPGRIKFRGSNVKFQIGPPNRRQEEEELLLILIS